MRILVADQNALLLAAIAATFGRHCEIVTATRQDVCMAHVAQHHFDVVVACEKLAGGYTGLELLSEVEAISPRTLRIFAARPETLQRLGKRLDLFGLLGTLHYPIEARKLLVGLKVARCKLPGRPKPPKVKHVVLENEWDTGERLALLGQELEDAPAFQHDEEPASSENVALDHEQPSTPEHAAVEQARHIAEASSFEVSFEVSFDENPSRYDVTGHGGTTSFAEEFVPEQVAPEEFAAEQIASEEVSPLEVSFDEDPNPFAFASPVANAIPGAFANDEPFKEAPPPATAAAAENEPYCDSSAANDEVFSDEPVAPQAHGDTTRGKTSAAAQAAATGETSTSARASVARETSAPAERPTSPASASAAQAGQRPTAARPNTPASAASKSATANSPAPPKQSTAKGPRPRKPTVPSAAQREAFQRALARRNAARAGGFVDEPPIDLSSMASMSAPVRSAQPRRGSSQSLSDLARMATTKRPLRDVGQPKRSGGNPTKRHQRAVGRDVGKRRVFVVGSGIAAVLLAAVVCFELLRTTPSGEHLRHGRATSAEVFSPASTMVADNSGGSPEIFTPAPPQPVATPQPGTDAPLPQPQTFDADTAPPDPPPPPALEQPGPMEPPSIGHHRPPWAPQGGSDTE